MNDDGWIIWLAVIGLAAWLGFFGGWTTVRGWLGQDTFEDRRVALEVHMRGNKIGSSADVWLVKGNFGVPDRVALFYGYLDDWEACWEFKTAYATQYPSDVYSCQFANQ